MMGGVGVVLKNDGTIHKMRDKYRKNDGSVHKMREVGGPRPAPTPPRNFPFPQALS